MSRIYDALQRADNERRNAHESATSEMADPFAARSSDAQLPAMTEVQLETVVRCAWRPSPASLPTLGDHGDSIEQFRGLRSQIYQLRDQAPLKTILVSSGIPAEGKSFVAANLAMSLARNKNNNVLLIDADLRSPSVHTMLGAPRLPGLTEYLGGGVELGEILQRYQDSEGGEVEPMRGISNVTFIPAGAGGDNSLELIANHRIEELIATLAPHFDWILIDSPPALAFADAIDLARTVDAVLLVAREAVTPYDVAQRAQAAFSNSRILGFVLNAARDTPLNTSYYYGYGKQETGSTAQRRKDKRR